MLEDILYELDIQSEEDFRYFEQLAALVEGDFELDYDTFAEIMMLPETEALTDMTSSFFEDLIRGIPDDNTDLYSVIQSIKDVLLSLAEHTSHRGRGFYADELYRFRQWYQTPDIIQCTPEGGGAAVSMSPCEAMMLFREEKLSGKKYLYDFSAGMPEEPDEYIHNIMAEMTEDDYTDNYDDSVDTEDEMAQLPIELPRDFDPETYDPDDPEYFSDIDPYQDGFVDRYDPVIEGPDIEYGDDY